MTLLANNFDPQQIWQSILARVQLQISQANFNTWFQNTKILEIDQEKMVVLVPNNFSKEWLENKYHKSLLKIAYEILPSIKEIKYVVSQTKPVISAAKNKKEEILPITGQLDFQEFSTEKETGLNPRYRFDNFVVGSFNDLAHAASWGVAEKPGMVYNPLFIYGGVGLGKTHLLQAIGNYVREKDRKKKIRYLTSEKFSSEMVAAIKNNNLESFKEKYRHVDLLIIDDVQFLSGKEKTQEEFFHVFNILYQDNRQIVISSDRPPKAISALEERLRSRFEGGMIADIGLPDLETRIAILKMKAKEKNLFFSEEIFHYIAENIRTNIRELEGALNQIAIFQRINSLPLELSQVKNILKKSIQKPQSIVNVKKIIQCVADFYDLKEKDILSSSRRQEVVKPRQVAMFLLREELKCSYPLIGRKFGGKDHTTAIYAIEKIKKEISKNENLKEEIEVIKQRIYSG
jgi:chromosomal replication initiator protein